LFEKAAKYRGVKLVLPPIEPGRSIQLRADPIALAHGLLANGVSNALKFSESGKTIELEFRELGDRVTILIRDQGPGLHPDVIRELQHQGRANSRPGVRGELGTGTGFQLMKFFVDSFGGEFEWQSASNGTELRFTLKKHV